MKRYLTTGMLAKAFEVAPQTVTRWCESGLLPHWHVPGAGHRIVGKGDRIMGDRRVSMSNAIAFAVAYGLPLEGLCGYQTAILLLSPDVPLVAKLRPLLPNEWETTSVGTLVAAGVALGRRRYNAVLLDGDLGAGVHEVLAHLPALQPGVPCGLLSSEDGSPELSMPELERITWERIKPVDSQRIVELLRQLVTTRASNGRKEVER